VGDVATGRVLDAGLQLLDRQLVDADGRLCGKVDDVEFEAPDGGGLPVATALLTGPGVLGQRSGGRIWDSLGRLHTWIARGLGGGPSRIPFTQVKLISHHIELTVSRADLDAAVTETWTRAHVIEKIPGAGHAAE
jgi:hypothetical protein